jgi:hypothetical protein
LICLEKDLRVKCLAKRGPGSRFEWPKLRELMTSPLLRLYYISYLSLAHNLENLHFVDEVQQFREKAASLDDHSGKICALARPIIDKYVMSDAPSQVWILSSCFFVFVLFKWLKKVNIDGSLRQQTILEYQRNVTVRLFDECEECVLKMMDRDVTIHFKHSAIGQELVRRLSPCRWPQEAEKVLKPVPDVVLVVEPVVVSTEDDLAVDPSSSSSSNGASVSGGKRRVGSFSLRSKKSESELKVPSRSSSHISSPPSIAELLSPRRSQSGSPRVPHIQLTKSGSEGNLDEQITGRTLEDALSRSPRKESNRIDSSRPETPTDSPSLSSSASRGMRLLPLTPPSQTDEEVMISPREMLREAEDSPVLEKKVSPRTKLRRIGLSTKNKVK